ncbi:hypothetical protein DFH06DRAFT_1321269 [Mycena polygramma]|nr:hypothetical protein DFH06DRAFT_1321269 [Mycena polygramma]
MLSGRTWLVISLICWHISFSFVHAFPHPLHSKHDDLGKRDSLPASGLTSASWIWTAEPTTGNVAFVRTFDSPVGKAATSATITMTAVNQFTLFVNGQPIGASGNGTDDWKAPQLLSAALNASANTFAVLAVNNIVAGGQAPGFLAAIQVEYIDGSGDSFVSDASWGVSAIIPPAFPTVSMSDASHFGAATIVGSFGSGSWGNVTVPLTPSNLPSLAGSTWIWSTSTAATGATTGTVGFRKTVSTPSAQSAQILVAADNGFLLYVNGQYIGAPPPAPVIPDFNRVQRFTVDLLAPSNTFTIFGQNIPNPGSSDAGPAGLVATIVIQNSDGSTSVVNTDASWQCGAFTTVPAFLSLDDSALSPSFALGTMGMAPWGQLTNVSDALAAPKVPTGPFSNGTVPRAAGGAIHIALIVGPIVGGIVLLGAALGLFCWCRRRRRQRRAAALSSEPFDATSSQADSSSVRSSGLYGPTVLSSMPPRSVTSQPILRPPAIHQGGFLPPSKLERERVWQSKAARGAPVDRAADLAAPPGYYDSAP